VKVIYENKDYIIIIKPHGVLSQKDVGGESGLVEMLSEQFGQTVYPVHRLDRPVGGVMVYAKNKKTAARLSENGAFDKTYLAVCLAPPPEFPITGEMEDYLYKDSAKGKSFAVKTERRGAKLARLAYEVLAVCDGLALMKIRLFTGRTHQIRVQLSSRGMPIAGDGKYGSRLKSEFISLWSHSLTVGSSVFSALPEQGDPYFAKFSSVLRELDN
jgi:23S rRNA pseudouridine1911/1915/1917 synthase